MNTTTFGPIPEVVLEPGLAAEQIDERLRHATRLSDVGHRATAFYLADLHDRGLSAALGRPTALAYAVHDLGMSRRHARELLQAGLRLRELPAIDAAFAEGRLTWSRARRLCEVATTDTEQDWLARALACTQDELDRLVRGARRGEAPPRDGGLPPARFVVRVELDALKWQMWENARAKLRGELGDQGDLRDEDLLLEMLRLVLSSDADGRAPGRKPVAGSVFQVVVRAPEGEAAPAVATDDGAEPIDDGAFEHAASDAATPARLRAEVFARDHHACRNCGARRRLHAHHVIWRSRGGPTTLANLVTLCARCHGLAHEGFLEIDADRRGGFVFRDGHGRRLGQRVLGGVRVTVRRPPEVAQCATSGPREPDAAWLAAHLDWFEWSSGRAVLKPSRREDFERAFGAGGAPPGTRSLANVTGV